ncbi:hypothetical protein Psi02_72890 [Planotetraspora silvatica]|uniref:Uncharacterized protein n=1 Tax=Planotetraspora silvatica TaxID=234614 RepID=A0A8J3V6G0_9ACTN|nr:hypothetical protein Psi02_72890 [Planotetraspora silvatica]
MRRVCSGSAYGDSLQVALGAAAAWIGAGSADVPDICRMLSGSIGAITPLSRRDRHGVAPVRMRKGRHSLRVPALSLMRV